MLKAVAALIINIINIYCVKGYSMKKIRIFLAFVLTVSVFTATACTSQTGESSSAADSQSVSQSQENNDSSSESEADSSQTDKPVTDYTTYVSNTVISTGNNFYIEEAKTSHTEHIFLSRNTASLNINSSLQTR